MIIAYVSRANLSVVLAIPNFIKSFHLSDTDRGMLNSAFFWAYAAASDTCRMGRGPVWSEVSLRIQLRVLVYGFRRHGVCALRRAIGGPPRASRGRRIHRCTGKPPVDPLPFHRDGAWPCGGPLYDRHEDWARYRRPACCLGDHAVWLASHVPAARTGWRRLVDPVATTGQERRPTNCEPGHEGSREGACAIWPNHG